MKRSLPVRPASLDTRIGGVYNIAISTAMEFINTVTLKNDTNKVIRRGKASKEPVIVTQHGHPAVAIIPLDESDLVFRREKAFRKAIGQGLKDIAKGRTVSLKSLVGKPLR